MLKPRRLISDRRLCQPADGGRVNLAALPSDSGEHGAQQPQPLPPGGARDHRGTAHRAPASVSTHTRTEARSRALIRWVGGRVLMQTCAVSSLEGVELLLLHTAPTTTCHCVFSDCLLLSLCLHLCFCFAFQWPSSCDGVPVRLVVTFNMK